MEGNEATHSVNLLHTALFLAVIVHVAQHSTARHYTAHTAHTPITSITSHYCIKHLYCSLPSLLLRLAMCLSPPFNTAILSPSSRTAIVPAHMVRIVRSIYIIISAAIISSHPPLSLPRCFAVDGDIRRSSNPQPSHYCGSLARLITGGRGEICLAPT